MSLAQTIQQHVDLLPQHQQSQVLDFVLFLEQKQQPTVYSKPIETFIRQPNHLAKQIKIVGDVFDSIPVDDWDLPT